MVPLGRQFPGLAGGASSIPFGRIHSFQNFMVAPERATITDWAAIVLPEWRHPWDSQEGLAEGGKEVHVQ